MLNVWDCCKLFGRKNETDVERWITRYFYIVVAIAELLQVCLANVVCIFYNNCVPFLQKNGIPAIAPAWLNNDNKWTWMRDFRRFSNLSCKIIYSQADLNERCDLSMRS